MQSSTVQAVSVTAFVVLCFCMLFASFVYFVYINWF